MTNRDADNTTNDEATSKKVICVYAQKDKLFYQELQNYLSLWQQEKYIQWLEISAGSDVKQTMRAYLQQADLILLLISPDFFAQGLCYSAMRTSLEEQARRQVPVVPVLARVSAWKESACGDLYALPDNEQPIAQWNHPEQAYEEIRSGLAYLMPGNKEFRQKLMRATTGPGTTPPATHESGSVNIVNQATNKGQQGNFYAPINNNYS